MAYLTAHLYGETVTHTDLAVGDVIATVGRGGALAAAALRLDKIEGSGDTRVLHMGRSRRTVAAAAPVWRAYRAADGELVHESTVHPAALPTWQQDMDKAAARTAIGAFLSAVGNRAETPDRVRMLAAMMDEATERYGRSAGLTADGLRAAVLAMTHAIEAERAERTPTHRVDVRYFPKAADGWESSGCDMAPLMLQAEDDMAAVREAMRLVWEYSEHEDVRVTVIRLAPDGDSEMVFDFGTPGLVISDTTGKGVRHV